MCAPISVGAIEPVGMTNASTTNARNTNARMNAIRIDSIVSFTPPSCLLGEAGASGFGGAGVSAGASVGMGADGTSHPVSCHPGESLREEQRRNAAPVGRLDFGESGLRGGDQHFGAFVAVDG